MFEKKNYWIICSSLFDTKIKIKTNKDHKLLWRTEVALHTQGWCQMQFKPFTVNNQMHVIACWVVLNGAMCS